MKRNLLAVSLITLSCLYGVLAAVIIAVFLLTGLPISIGLIISLIIVVVQFLIAPAINDFVFKHLYHCKWDYQVPDYLREFIEQECSKYNMKFPKIGFIDDGSPNAFTYGRTKNDARVVFSRGIIDLLTPEEVKAVIAHELGHAVHYDMLFMTVAQIVPLVLYYVADLLLNVGGGSSRSSSSSSNDSGGNYAALIGLISYILYLISQYIILWLSRTREYYADSFSVEETKDPSSLARALIKIGFGLSIGDKNNEENSKLTKGNALGINNAKVSKGIAISAYNNGGVSKEAVINAMKWERWNYWAKLVELNSTHPLISKRLLAISDRCEEFGQERYIEFNEEKPESYADDFFIELGLCILPIVIIFATMVAAFICGSSRVCSPLIPVGVGGMLLVGSLFILLNRSHKNKDYRETNVSELLSEVKVSNVTSIPCILHGKIIGRGNPGCVFNEDFVLQDDTGIIFLDYNQPLTIINKIFALFKSKEYFDKEVTIKGWYRRSTAPYVEIYSMLYDGQEKKCHTYMTTKVLYAILLGLSVASIFAGFGIL